VEYNFDDEEPRTRWWIIITVAIVITVAVGGYFAWRGSRQAVPTKETAEPTTLPRMANLPPKKEAPKPVPPPYSPDAPCPSLSRRLIHPMRLCLNRCEIRCERESIRKMP
jgi:hypothetical protein